MDTPLQIIDAFIDGERVNPSELKRVLADAAARDYLVDAWLLRESLQETMMVETPAPMPNVAASRPRVSWPIAASIAAACLASGYGAAQLLRPEAPAAVVSPATTVEATGTDTSFPVPPPTRVIRLEQGVNWRESTGGN